MRLSADRLSGLFFLAFGLALYFVVIPYDTETVGYGWVRPATMPNIMALTMALAGAALALRPGGAAPPDPRRTARAALFLGLTVAGVAATAELGFEIVAPLLALAIMLAIGERRSLWLALGVVGVPLLIWLCVAVLLDRPMP